MSCSESQHQKSNFVMTHEPYRDDPDGAEPACPLPDTANVGSSDVAIRKLESGIAILTPLSLTFCVLAALILIAEIMVSAIGSRYVFHPPDDLLGNVQDLAYVGALAMIVSAVNVYKIGRKRQPAVGLNLLMDLLIFVLALVFGIMNTVDTVSYGWYGCDWNGPGDNRKWREDCMAFRHGAKIVSLVGFSWMMLLGIVHLVMFSLRCRLAILKGIWNQPWSISKVKMYFEVTIRVKEVEVKSEPRQAQEPLI